MQFQQLPANSSYTELQSADAPTPRLPRGTYPEIIRGAIERSPNGMCSLREIYDFAREHYRNLTISKRSWKNSIRHRLFYSPEFERVTDHSTFGGGRFQINPNFPRNYRYATNSTSVQTGGNLRENGPIMLRTNDAMNAGTTQLQRGPLTTMHRYPNQISWFPVQIVSVWQNQWPQFNPNGRGQLFLPINSNNQNQWNNVVYPNQSNIHNIPHQMQ
ncbi:hypothetical protein ACOME3_002754 [Neoechinorhynchus agilis]